MLSTGPEPLIFWETLLRSCLKLNSYPPSPCPQVRETETMDAQWLDNVGSGDLPDDEDIGEFTPHLTSDEFDIDDTSGSGGEWGKNVTLCQQQQQGELQRELWCAR